MKLQTNEEVLKYINEELNGYEGYLQFSHRPIDKDKDIFYDGKVPKVENEEGFVYEAHFANEEQSISIRQINDTWLVSTTVFQNIFEENVEKDIQKYITYIENFDYKVKMAQIWVDEADELCENMIVKKLKKVVFAGFEKKRVKAQFTEKEKEKLLKHFLSIFQSSYISSILEKE